MKNLLKLTGFFAALSLVVFTVLCANGCKSSGSGRKIIGEVPKSVRDAVMSAPKDVLIGIGTAKLSSINLSRVTAQTRARAEISLQMNAIVQTMVRRYNAPDAVDSSEITPFTERITVIVSESRLQGSQVVAEHLDKDGNYWAVVYLKKENAVAEISQAQAAAKLAVPGLASFNADDLVNEAFDIAASQDIVVTAK